MRKGRKAGLYVCMPYRENVWGTVLEGQEGSWRAEAVQTEEGERLLCVDRRTGRLRIYDWNKEADFTERPVLEEAEHRLQMESLEAAWQREKAAWQQEKEERMIQCRKEYESRVERLRAEYEGKLARCREGYELQLEQAKKQYNELAQTAVKLQKIGRKWRDKYFGRIEEKA